MRDSSGFVRAKCLVRRKLPVDPCRLTFKRMKGIVVCGCMQCLPAFNGADTHLGRRNWSGSDGSGDRRLYSSSCRTTAIVANTLKGLGGKLRSLRLGGTIGCWLPNSYGNVGSFESESIVTICGSGEATEEIVIVSLAIAPVSSVELRIAGELFLIGLLSADERST